MDAQVKRKAIEIIATGTIKIVSNYSDNALLINACFVSSDRYKNLKETTGLSTINGIPNFLRLDHEVDVQYTNEQLAEKYEGGALSVIFNNYVVMSVSIVDGVLEDIYELFIQHFETDLSQVELDKKVRLAWTNDNLINYLLSEDKVNLKKPKDMKTEIEELFMRYKELRIIRHSIVHSDGIISHKNFGILNDYLNKTPDSRKNYALLNSSIVGKEKNVILSINIILSIRQYLDRFLAYFYKSINNT